MAPLRCALLLLAACNFGGLNSQLSLGAACSNSSECAQGTVCLDSRCSSLDTGKDPGLDSATPAAKTLVITPRAVSLLRLGSAAFTAAYSDGSAATVMWSATGGSIDAQGVFTAPNATATFEVTARDASATATAQVTVGDVPEVTNLVIDAVPDALVFSFDPVPGATSYRIVRSQSASGPFDPVTQITSTEYTHVDGEYGVSYYFAVIAMSQTAEGPISEPQLARLVSGRELCVLDQDAGSVRIYEAMQNGDYPPLRSYGTQLTGIGGANSVAIVAAENEMLVATDNDILTFPLHANGDLAPTRRLHTADSFNAIAYDATHDVIYTAEIGNRVRVYARTASGADEPLRTIQGDTDSLWNPQDIAFDDATNEIVIGTINPVSNTVVVLDWDATTANAKYSFGFSSSGHHVAVDPGAGDVYAIHYHSPSGIATTCVKRLRRPVSGAALEEQNEWCLPAPYSVDAFDIDPGRGEAVFAARINTTPRLSVASLSNGAAVRTITGIHTRLDYVTDFQINRATHAYVVPNRYVRSVQTFTQPATGDIAPDTRIGGTFGGRPLAIAADIPRGELYIVSANEPAIQVLHRDTGAILRTPIDTSRGVNEDVVFEENTDNLFVRRGTDVHVYPRPSAAEIIPTYAISTVGQYGLALDSTHSELVTLGYGVVRVFASTATTSTPTRTFNFTVGDNSPYGACVLGNDYLIHTADNAMKTWPSFTTGTDPTPSNVLTGAFTHIDDAIAIDRRGVPLMYNSSSNEKRVRVYSPASSGAASPLRTIGGPGSLRSISAITICK